MSIQYLFMKAHLTKQEFKFVSITVMVLEVASFLVFIFGTLGAILGTYSGISISDFIFLGLGSIFVALILMAIGESLQIFMKIEYNTRKENTLLSQQMQVQAAEVQATRNVASVLSHAIPKIRGVLKRPKVKKLKAGRRR